MTKPDHITTTAPKRIYLDLGDCAHLIRADETFADFAGEATWSEDNATGCGVPYVRADLVTTPHAASGAAPSVEFNLHVMATNRADGRPWDVLDREACRRGANEIRQLRASLATREASASRMDEREQLRAEQAANVMPQIGPLLDAWDGLDNGTACLIRDEAPDLKRALETIGRAIDGAALASPQVAPALTINGEPATAHSILAALVDIHDDDDSVAPEHRSYVPEAWGDTMRMARTFLAAPVQVAPAPVLKATLEAWELSATDMDSCATGDGQSAWYSRGMANGIRLCVKDLNAAAPVQVAPAAIDFAKPLETTEGEPVKHVCHDVIQYRSAQVCIDKSTGRSYSGPYPGLTIRNVAAPMQPGAAADDARDAAEEIGRTGAPYSGSEHALFRAYLKGHCWKEGPWIEEEQEYADQWNRVLFAVWRARGAISTPAAKPAEEQGS